MVEIFQECRSMSKGMYYDQLSSLGLGQKQTSTQEAKPFSFLKELSTKGQVCSHSSPKLHGQKNPAPWNEANIRIMNMTKGWNVRIKYFQRFSPPYNTCHFHQSQVMIGGMHIQIINSCQSDKTIRFLIHLFSLTTRASRVCHTFMKRTSNQAAQRSFHFQRFTTCF